MIVEAETLHSSHSAQTKDSIKNDHSTQPIQVNSGYGGQSIDLPKNEFGLEYLPIEGFEELSTERGSFGPWTLREEWSQLVQTHLLSDFSLDQKIKLRSYGMIQQSTFDLQIGYLRDHRDFSFVDNHGTPYDLQDDFDHSIPFKKDQGFFQFKWEGEIIHSLIEADWVQKDLLASAMKLGVQSQRQAQLTLKKDFQSLGEWIPFFQVKNARFESEKVSTPSVENQGYSIGIKNSFYLFKKKFHESDLLSYEGVERSYSSNKNFQFSRLLFTSHSAFGPFIFPYFEFSNHFIVQVLRDQAFAASESFQGIWDAGIELSTPHSWNIWGESFKNSGIQFKLRRYAILPTISQRYGDGVMLLPSLGLPSEEGVRMSIGPWIEGSKGSMSLDFFSEESTHAPIMVGVSPTAAKTLPIGGVWSRGAELHFNLNSGLFSLNQDLTYQNALNRSSINWQMGKPVPGRPQWISQSKVEFHKKLWKAGMGHQFKSEESMDLAGLWFKPPLHFFESYLGYEIKNWSFLLKWKQLLSKEAPTAIEGMASPNLLEPEMNQSEVRILCETRI